VCGERERERPLCSWPVFVYSLHSHKLFANSCYTDLSRGQYSIMVGWGWGGGAPSTFLARHSLVPSPTGSENETSRGAEAPVVFSRLQQSRPDAAMRSSPSRLVRRENSILTALRVHVCARVSVYEGEDTGNKETENPSFFLR